MIKQRLAFIFRTIFFIFVPFSVIPIQSSNKPTQELPIVVVIPSYNNKECYEKNLSSVFEQKYQNYSVIYIDDASPDGTGKLVQDYVKEHNQGHRFTLIKNKKRVGALANIYNAISQCRPYEIVANLDGDDWFYNEHVLEKLNQVYSDPHVWVTYGQFVYYPTGAPGWAEQVPEAIIAANEFRDYNWVTTALRSFYAGLFHKIHKEDLLYEGTFYQMAADLAYMWPIVEMAGVHSRFIPDVLYVYNVETGINDGVKDREQQLNLGFHIRTKKRYQPVEKPY